jgi:hypothetical protein
VDLAVAQALHAMPPAQRLGMKNRWVLKAHRPREEDLPRYVALRHARMLARGEACEALRQRGMDLVGPEIISQSGERIALQGWADVIGSADPAAAVVARFADLERQFQEFPRVEKWADTIDNIVVNAGLNHILDVVLSGGTQITTWYLGLLSATPTVAAGDTMASHGGWTEITAYDEAVRQTFVEAGASGQCLSNSASPAAFTAGNKDLDDNDTLSVTLTATAAAA